MSTLAEVKQLAERVLQFPADVAFHSAEAYEALSALRAAVGRALTGIREGCPAEVLEEIDRLCTLKNGRQKRKHAGTGSGDTSEETWEQMRAASLAGETLRSLSARF